jgi:hypothetical protein
MTNDAAVQNNVDRQSQFFLGEEDASGHDYNPLVAHSTLLLHGYQALLQRPMGSGLGATSAAASKFGGAASHTTETDLGDVMVATGVPGAIAYHVMIFFIGVTAIRYWRGTRSTLALAIMGLLGSHFLLWLGGGLYAVSAIVWFCIGSLDVLERDRAKAAALGTVPAPAP